MKIIYFVTEGNTDKIVLEGLIQDWLGTEDFVSRHIQPPSSEYMSELVVNLSQGWKGVTAWCRGERKIGAVSRDEVLLQADCLVIHIDADVALDAQFFDPPLGLPVVPRVHCDWVRSQISIMLGGAVPNNVVLCVPSQDTESWVLTALHVDISDANQPIENCEKPARLLPKKPHKLTRFRDGELKKLGQAYSEALPSIIRGWSNCIDPVAGRTPEAIRFEAETRSVLGL